MPSKSNPNPTAKVQTILAKLEAAAIEAAKVLNPVAKQLKSALDALNVEALPPGAASDLMYQLRQASKVPETALAAFEDVFKPFDKLLEEHFINTLAAGESSGVQGALGRIQINTSTVPVVEDWAAFYAYIAKTKGWELMNKAPNTKSIRERWELKKEVPGVKPFIKKTVSCTKIPGR